MIREQQIVYAINVYILERLGERHVPMDIASLQTPAVLNVRTRMHCVLKLLLFMFVVDSEFYCVHFYRESLWCYTVVSCLSVLHRCWKLIIGIIKVENKCTLLYLYRTKLIWWWFCGIPCTHLYNNLRYPADRIASCMEVEACGR